ncbi:upstream activation factor subunit spp27-like isoform X4 [Malania oleifera]|uniref:upstream activation factor subunit spp27-like isoform X4 n=1 Tax=Malania oleifera TaxID=397392 RepID=UPI0025AE8023|nr:upstream activation factor subunit spp27-like isoform X4 [Malania oleifera]
MVSDSELVGRLREFLRTSDLDTTTTGTVRRQLEEDFGVDLSAKKAFIREQVDLFLQSQFEKAGEDDYNEGEREDEENQEAEVKLEGSEGNGSKEGDEDEEEEEEESNGKSTGKKRSNKQNKEVKKRGGGFNKLCSLSPQLQQFVGVPEMARTEVVKQLWAYIREKNLQDPSNRRNIICDEALHAVFGVGSINMFQMNKALSKHIWPLEAEDAPAKSTQKEKQRKQEKQDDEPKRKEKRRKGGNSGGFLAPLPLSDALVKFLGTGEKALSRADVVKRMWEYIKQNNLQDPSDKRRIICDEKLKELFDVDSFNGFTVAKLLSTHFVKTEHYECGCEKEAAHYGALGTQYAC